MYKKQMRVQKTVCLLAIIAAAVLFVYALGIITDIYDGLYFTMASVKDPMKDPSKLKIPGAIIYFEMQEFNSQFVNRSIVLILLACLLFITNTQVRRKYYIGNFVAIGAYSATAIAVSIWSHQQIEAFKHQYLTTIDFEKLKEFCDLLGKEYIDSTLWFDLHYVALGLLLLSVAALLGNMIWKICLMRAESKLLAAGKETAV